MRQISQAALTALLGAQPPYVKKITLERRAWNGSAYAFETPVDITSDLVEVGKTNFKLYEEGYNVWSYSNCTITVRNERNQWKEGNPDGYFPDGTVAAMSRITIEAGVFLEDGSVELAPVFCGYISEGAELLPDGRNAQLTVLGPMARLDAISAEDAAQFITGELAGSDSGTQFTTAQSGVGSIDKVLRGLTSSGVSGAVELVSSIDYTVAQLNEYSLGAKITLEQALSSGQSLWVSYRYWYRDQTVDALVGIVLDLAGVASRSVAVPEFAYGIRNTFSQTDQTGFATGQYSNTMWNPDVSGVSLLWNDYILRWWTPGTYVSPVIDGTANFMNWGAFNAGQQVPTGTTSSFTVRESADGATWSEWADLAPGAQIPATLRYIQLRWNAACTLDPTIATPVLISWTAEYFTSNVTIHQCDMSGYSCQDALEALATLCAFECGFDAAETFIFRPRSSSASSVISLDGCSVISADNLSSGADRVYNHVVVKFGDSTRVATTVATELAASWKPLRKKRTSKKVRYDRA